MCKEHISKIKTNDSIKNKKAKDKKKHFLKETIQMINNHKIHPFVDIKFLVWQMPIIEKGMNQ